MKDAHFPKLVLFVNAAVPLAILAFDAVADRLGANPVEFFIRTTGTLTLIFLTLSLAVTPVRKLTGFNFLSHFRRTLGLYAFFYGFVHLLAYVGFDRSFSPGAVIADTIQRPFITFGMAGFIMMVPLAITSTNAAIKRMGAKRWKRLHRLAYASAVAGVVHYWMLVKVVDGVTWGFALAVGALLLYRVVDSLRPKTRAKIPARAPS